MYWRQQKRTSPHRRYSNLRSLTTALWAFALGALSLQPRRPAGAHNSSIHIAAHTAAFALLALLPSTLHEDRQFSAKVFFACSFYGLAIEVLQHIIFATPFEWWDVRDDVLGAAAGVLVCYLFRLHRQRRFGVVSDNTARRKQRITSGVK